MAGKSEEKKEACVKKLETAFFKLPLLPNKKKTVPQIIENLILHSGLSRVNDLPTAKVCGRKQAIKELEKLIKQAEAMRSHINAMHKSSLEVLTQTGYPHPYVIEHDLKLMITLYKNSNKKISTLPLREKGKPKKNQAAAITNFLAKAYEGLTGKRATRIIQNEKAGGLFYSLVKDVFNVLGIKASAEVHIRNLMVKTSKKITT